MDTFDHQRTMMPSELVEASGAYLPSAVRDFRRLVRERVDGGAGFIVFTGVDRAPEGSRKDVLIQLSRLLGDVVAQDGSGTLIREVRDRGQRVGEGRSARYSDSRFGGDLHTDGAEAPLPVPDYFTLLCIRQAASGGALQLVPLGRVLTRLREYPDVGSVLAEPFHFDRRGDEPAGEHPTTLKPVVFRARDGRPAVTYLRKYIEVAHARPDVPNLTVEQRRALDVFDAILADPTLVIQDTLRPGELAIFDNLRVLHGRTEFVDPPGGRRGRLLYRTWIRNPDPSPVVTA